jgi:putative endonuclease
VNRGERVAACHYVLRGHRLLDANARAGGYELDLVLRRGRVLVFVEVKQRASDAYGGAMGAVGREKRRRVRRAASAWLSRHPRHRGLEVRYEIAAVRGLRVRRVTMSAE